MALLAQEAYAGTDGGGEVGGMSMDWISVKDRLPEDDTPVIALCRHASHSGVWYWATEFTTHKSNMWHDGTARYWLPLPKLPPLPEPPKEEHT